MGHSLPLLNHIVTFHAAVAMFAMALSMFSILCFFNDFSLLPFKAFYSQCQTFGLVCFEHGCYQDFSDDTHSQNVQSVLSFHSSLVDKSIVRNFVWGMGFWMLCVWLLIRLYRLCGISMALQLLVIKAIMRFMWEQHYSSNEFFFVRFSAVF